MTETVITGRDEVVAALSDPRLLVPEAPPGSEGMAWLRCSVSRFTNGQTHQRRRDLIERELAQLEPARLATAAKAATRRALTGAGSGVDILPLARAIPVRVFCEALMGSPVGDQLVADGVAVAASYPLSSSASPAADAALSRLVAVFGGGEDGAARIAILAQACDATAALISNTLLGDDRVPVRLTRRTTGVGEPVVLDLDGSGLPFGAGPRACPGKDQALAMATAVVRTIRELGQVIEDEVEYQSSPNLRIPARLRIRLTDR